MFRLMRALQQVPREREREVATLPELTRLLGITTSPIFGPTVRGSLVP